jgi:hypothetical protein
MHSDPPSANVENERRKSCMEKNTPGDSPILGISFFGSARRIRQYCLWTFRGRAGAASMWREGMHPSVRALLNCWAKIERQLYTSHLLLGKNVRQKSTRCKLKFRSTHYPNSNRTVSRKPSTFATASIRSSAAPL